MGKGRAGRRSTRDERQGDLWVSLTYTLMNTVQGLTTGFRGQCDEGRAAQCPGVGVCGGGGSA